MFDQLNSALNAGRWKEAEALARQLLMSLPENADLLRVQGYALHKLQRNVEGLLACESAVKIRPMFPDAWALIEQILAILADSQPRYSVTVITGGEHLPQALHSVNNQSYPNVRHAVVVDGHSYRNRVDAVLQENALSGVDLYELPNNIGGGGYNGHRVYGSFPFLVDTEFVAFLDEDNWYEPEHLETLMAKVTKFGLTWAYGLRKIVDGEGRRICDDDCESLGQWPTWNSPTTHLVDANCYLLRRDVAVTLGRVWNRRFRDGLSPDFLLCQELLRQFPRCDTNGLSTVNYRVGSTALSVCPEFFLSGNKASVKRYGEGFPWRKEMSASGQRSS